jgi:exonuclease SbcC
LAVQTGKARTAADKHVQKGETAHQKVIDELGKARVAAEAAQGDLKARASDELLTSQWEPIRTRLDQLITKAEGLEAAARDLERRDEALGRFRTALKEDRGRHEADGETALSPLQQTLDGTKSRLQELVGTGRFAAARKSAGKEVQRAKDAVGAFQAAVAPVGAARKSAADLEATGVQVVAITKRVDQATEALVGLATEVDRGAKAEASARAAQDRIRRMAALIEHRVTLVDGEPCLLCGSEEHPWAGDADQLAKDEEIAAAVAADEEAYKAAYEALEQAKQGHVEGEGARRALVAQLDLLSGQQRKGAVQGAKLEKTAATALGAAELPVDSSTKALDAALAEGLRRSETAQTALSSLEVGREAVAAAEADLRTANEARKKTEGSLATRQATADERTKRLDGDNASHAEAVAGLADGTVACSSDLEKLELSVVGDDPTVWRDAGDARVKKHRLRVTAAADLKAKVAKLEAREAGAANLSKEVTEQRDNLILQLTEQETDRDGKEALAQEARSVLDAAWKTVLAADTERAPDTIPPPKSTPTSLLKAQTTRADTYRLDREKAAEVHQAAKTALKEAQTKRKTLGEQSTELGKTRLEGREVLDAVLAALSLDDYNTLRSRRLKDERLAKLRAQRSQLKELKAEVDTRFVERRGLVESHTEARPVTLPDAPDRDTLAVDVAECERRHKAAETTQQETSDQLRDHHKAVRDREQHVANLRKAEGDADVWERLHACIGVNNGALFKQFAQALNLQQLLDKANVHLARLKKRYQLVPRLDEGLPTLEFDLSDLWQAGERVAPRSLSGGERFLVSLSLALGLSDFRAVKMPIETLLLDEGFGTLDPAALSVALGALSQLQADGRQVGIISHVVGLQDQIEARIEIRPIGGGRSTVVTGGG